jgi:hypothetical protein
MGNKQTNKQKASKLLLSEKDITVLLENTNFTRNQIVDWHSGFLVIYCCFNLILFHIFFYFCNRLIVQVGIYQRKNLSKFINSLYTYLPPPLPTILDPKNLKNFQILDFIQMEKRKDFVNTSFVHLIVTRMDISVYYKRFKKKTKIFFFFFIKILMNF